MTPATHISLRLTRFPTRRPAARLQFPAGSPDVLFSGVGADTRAAGTEPISHEAFVLLQFGIHPSREAAQRFAAATATSAPAPGDALESWSAILEPFRYHGQSNHLDRAAGSPVFETLAPPPAPDEPIVVITSAGWRAEGLDPERVREFSTGVQAVRAGMTGVAGLLSQQSFFFPGALEVDPVTVTTWRSFDAMRAWAYGPGAHRHFLDRHRAEPMADRTSFTRCRILESAGTWYREALGR